MRFHILASVILTVATMQPLGGQGSQQSLTRESAQASRVAATAGLDTLRGLARTHFQILGFSEAGQAATAALGEPLVEFLVRLDSLKAFSNTKNPMSLLTGGDKVMYPVLLGGATRSTIQVERVKGTWRPVTYGASTLAIALTGARAQLANAEGKSLAEYFIVRVPALGYELLGTTVAGELRLAPLVDDPRGRWRRGTSIQATTLFGMLVAEARASKGLPI